MVVEADGDDLSGLQWSDERGFDLLAYLEPARVAARGQQRTEISVVGERPRRAVDGHELLAVRGANGPDAHRHVTARKSSDTFRRRDSPWGMSCSG
jgi:hypothetical protein